jgi:thiol-disulfide isomerase/thioredoxin
MAIRAIRGESLLAIMQSVRLRSTLSLVILQLVFPMVVFSESLQRMEDPQIQQLPAQDSLVLVNFWASWCAPCIQEIPILNRLHQQRPEIKMIGISVDAIENEGAVKKFIGKHSISYPIVLRQGRDFDGTMNFFDPGWKEGLPATFVFKNGQRIYSKIGALQESDLSQIFK